MGTLKQVGEGEQNSDEIRMQARERGRMADFVHEESPHERTKIVGPARPARTRERGGLPSFIMDKDVTRSGQASSDPLG